MTDSRNQCHEREVTASELSLMEWLGRDDFGQYGECHGKDLDALIAKGFAQIHEPRIGQSGFIAKGDSLMYRAVSLTDEGRAALNAQMTAQPEEQSPLSRETISKATGAAS
jgi:hypothetical protein